MKRYVIYVIYDPCGEIHSYVQRMLFELRQIASKLVLVCNFAIDKGKVPSYVDELYARENKGFDAAAYKEIIIKNQNEILESDELIITNDSYYGPLYPFYEMFEKMDKEDCDYWGVTKHPGGYVDKIPVPEHIQSYFMAFEKTIISNPSFYDFWRKLRPMSVLEKVIMEFEIGINRFLVQNNYVGKNYMECMGFGSTLEIGENPYINHSYELIKFYRMPFFKRKSLMFDSDFYSEGLRALEFIRDNTYYDIKQITHHYLFLSEQNRDKKTINYISLNSFINKHNALLIYGNGKWAHNLDHYFEFCNFPIPIHVVTNRHGAENAILFSDVTVSEGMGVIIAIADNSIASDVRGICLDKFKTEDIFLLCKS